MAKAWVGSDVKKSAARWEIVEPLDRVRECANSRTSTSGEMSFPPVHWASISSCATTRESGSQSILRRSERHDPLWDIDPFRTPFFSEDTKKAIDKGQNVYEVRTAQRAMGDVPMGFAPEHREPYRCQRPF